MCSPSVTRPDVTLSGMTALCACVTRLRNGCGSLARPAMPKENDWFEAASEATLRLRREVKPHATRGPRQVPISGLPHLD